MNKDQKHINWELLERVIAGRGGEAEQQAVQTWLETDSQNQDLYKRIQQSLGFAALELERAKKGNPHFDTDLAWAEMQSNMQTQSNIKPLWQQTWAKAAAAIALIALAAFFIFQNDTKSVEQRWTSIQNTHSTLQKITLPDGSIVSLASDSKLEYTASGRQSKLNGMAFFEVHKDALHPFTVQAEQLIVTVIGTQFQLESGDTMRVQVLEGKVKLEDADNQLVNAILMKGEEAIFVPRNKLLKKVKNDPNRMSWKTDEYVFREAKISTIVQKMEAFYGVNIQLPGGIDLSSSMDLRINKKDLKSSAERMAFFLKLEVEIKDQELIFK